MVANLTDSGTGLSIHDATWELWSTDEADAPIARLAGGFAERMLLDGEFGRRPLQYQGGHFSGNHHEDESHTIEMHRPVLMERLPLAAAAINLPSILRNRRCGLTVVWREHDEGVWLKRSYFGVSLQPVRLEGDGESARKSVMSSVVKMRAERMTEEGGSVIVPVTGLVISGEVRWISGAENVLLYQYGEGAFVAAATLAGRATIDMTVTGEVTVRFADTPALVADADGLHCAAYDATGPTFGTGTRLEFWHAGVRRATLLADGTLIAPALVEADPSVGSAMVFGNPGALFSISSAGVKCLAFSDDL